MYITALGAVPAFDTHSERPPSPAEKPA